MAAKITSSQISETKILFQTINNFIPSRSAAIKHRCHDRFSGNAMSGARLVVGMLYILSAAIYQRLKIQSAT